MLAATTAAAAATSPRLASPYLNLLPQTLRFALVAKHQQLDAENKKKPGGATNPFRLDEDAATIVQHLRDKVPLRQIKLLDRQSASAAKQRWTLHINRWHLDGMDKLRHGTLPFQNVTQPAAAADSVDSSVACKLRQQLDPSISICPST
jgi:hypothetical protein